MAPETDKLRLVVEYQLWEGIYRNLGSIMALIRKHKLDPLRQVIETEGGDEVEAEETDVRLLK